MKPSAVDDEKNRCSKHGWVLITHPPEASPWCKDCRDDDPHPRLDVTEPRDPWQTGAELKRQLAELYAQDAKAAVSAALQFLEDHPVPRPVDQ